MIIREHALEAFYLRRRLELLDIFDGFASEEFYKDNPEELMDPNEHRLAMLEKQFVDVIDPYHLNETLKGFYRPETYGPAPEK